MLPSQYSENRWLQTERKVTILTMPMGTKRRQKEPSTQLPEIKTSVSTANHYLKQFSRIELDDSLSLPPIQPHQQQLIYFKQFAKVNAHYEERRSKFRSCVGKEKAIESQIDWRKAKNELQTKKIQLCHQIYTHYSADLKGSLHKMIKSYAKGEIKLTSQNARRYAEQEERKREEEIGKQFGEIEQMLSWKFKCETSKIVNIINFIHKKLNESIN